MTGKRGISFSETVAGNSNSITEYSVQADATVEKLSVRIYPGPETDFKIYPEIKREQADTVESLVRFEGKQYVDGDDDVFEWDLSVPLYKDDVIQVRAENNTGNEYDYRANLEIDERNGPESLADAILG